MKSLCFVVSCEFKISKVDVKTMVDDWESFNHIHVEPELLLMENVVKKWHVRRRMAKMNKNE